MAAVASLRKISGCLLAAAVVVLACAPGALGAAIHVTTGADTSAAGECSLRAAITAANTNSPRQACETGEAAEVDEIQLGVRILERAGPFTGDNDNATGDLDVTSSVTLVGAGPSRTKIDAQDFDRAIHVLPPGNATIRGATVTGGRSPAGGAGVNGEDGGGIYNEGTLTIEDSQVVANTAGNGGGTGNGGDGGGVFNTGTLTITNSLVADNHSGLGGSAGSGGSGGGIAGGAGSATLTNATIAANQASGSGGGVATGGGTLTLLHATVAGNLSGTGPDLTAAGGTTRLENSIAGGCSGSIDDGGGNVGAGGCPGSGDARLGPLQDNGGPTPTMALGAGSAAIDRIPATAGACLLATDQRGAARPAGPACDAGAFEAAPAPAVAAGGGPAPDETAPSTSQAAVDPSTFAVAGEATPGNGNASARARPSVARGTTIRYRLSEPANVLLSIEQQTRGLNLSRSKRGKAECRNTRECCVWRKANS